MIDGTKITLGDREFIAAPLNFKAMEEFAPLIESLRDGVDFKNLSMVRGMIAASLRRNHPDITDEFLLEWLDMRNVKPLMVAVLDVSGATAAEGEAKPVIGNGQPRTGETSTST